MRIIKTYNIAIAGYGAFGRFLKRSWERLPNVKVLSLMRSTEERARASAEADGIPGYTSDYTALLKAPDIDIVVIATPPYMHADQAVAALEAGKHVLIEKPLATSVEEGERVLDTAAHTGRKATVNFIMRYNPVIELVKQVVDKGLLGNLYRVLQENYASYQGLGSDHWFWDVNKSGGIFVEHGVHFFDLVNWMTDADPDEVQGMLTSREPGIEDKVLANVRYSNNTLATFYNSFSRPAAIEKTWGLYVFDRGEISTKGWIPLKLDLRAFVSSAELVELESIFAGVDIEARPVTENLIESSGRSYRVNHEAYLSYDLKTDKEEVYAQSAADLLADFIASIDDPGYTPRVTLDDAIKSLRIACQASDYR